MAALMAAPQSMRALDSLLVAFTAKSGTQVVRPAPTDLSFTSVAPGGYEAMTCTLDWPHGWPPGDSLAIGSTAQVVDRRTADVVWHGQVTDPGTRRSVKAASQQVTSQGFSRRMGLNGGPVAYVDRRLESWVQGPSLAAGQSQTTSDEGVLAQNPNDWEEPSAAVLMMTIPEGTVLRAGGAPMYVTYLHPRWSSSGQNITAIVVSVDGIDSLSADLEIKVRLWNQGRTVTNTPTTRAYSSIGPTDHLFPYQGSPGWTLTNARQADLTFGYTGSGATTSRDYWAKWGNAAVVFSRLDRSGNAVNQFDPNVQVRDVIDDVIGRWLRDDYDITQAIATPSTLVSQACWWEGATAKQILDAMIELNPSIFYAVWEPDTPGGKPRFEVITWDREPRYVIPANAGRLNLQGGGDELFNRVVVGYLSGNGVQATTVVTGNVAELTAAGEERTLMLDLTGEGSITLSQAVKRGTAALTAADMERTSGTATITAPILDRKTGRMVEPWEIRPGHAVTFTDVQPRADNGTQFTSTGARDGKATFRLTQTSFSASSGACELSLDGGQRTLYRRIRQMLPK